MGTQEVLEQFHKWIEKDVSGDPDLRIKMELLKTIKTDLAKAKRIVFEQIHIWGPSFKEETGIDLGTFDFNAVVETMIPRLKKVLS